MGCEEKALTVFKHVLLETKAHHWTKLITGHTVQSGDQFSAFFMSKNMKQSHFPKSLFRASNWPEWFWSNLKHCKDAQPNTNYCFGEVLLLLFVYLFILWQRCSSPLGSSSTQSSLGIFCSSRAVYSCMSCPDNIGFLSALFFLFLPKHISVCW